MLNGGDGALRQGCRSTHKQPCLAPGWREWGQASRKHILTCMSHLFRAGVLDGPSDLFSASRCDLPHDGAGGRYLRPRMTGNPSCSGSGQVYGSHADEQPFPPAAPNSAAQGAEGLSPEEKLRPASSRGFQALVLSSPQFAAASLLHGPAPTRSTRQIQGRQ